MNLLILLVIVLAVVAIAQLTRVYEQSRTLRQNKEEDINAADNKMNANLWLVWMFLFFSGVIYLYVKYGNYLPEAASAHGVAMDKLMMINIALITVVFFLVNATLFYFAFKYRFKKGIPCKIHCS